MRIDMQFSPHDLPPVRGKLLIGAPLAPYCWFRVGGPADALFLPADEEDLCTFLSVLPSDINVTVLGVGSNVIIRDGGIEGVVIRLAGRYWGRVDALASGALLARTGALDLAIARAAAGHGIAGLSFLSGIPGTIGGACRTNAGCYGRELEDVLDQLIGVNRHGELVTLQGQRADYGLPQLGLDYRHSDLPEDFIVTEVLLGGEDTGEPAALRAEIEDLQAKRAATQPIREKTSGSTFANPDPPGSAQARSAWKLIDAAGCRGLRVGGAQVSEKHCNFLINTGAATAADIEALGELVRRRVLETSGVALRWEVRRIGRLAAPGCGENSA